MSVDLLDKLEPCWNSLPQNLQSFEASFEADIFAHYAHKITDTIKFKEKRHANLLSLMACPGSLSSGNPSRELHIRSAYIQRRAALRGLL